jgi:hypothetical protein
MVMERDIKDIVGVLMRVLDGGEVLPAELNDLDFEAEGELEAVLNAAFIKLQEFAYDRELRQSEPAPRSRDARRAAGLPRPHRQGEPIEAAGAFLGILPADWSSPVVGTNGTSSPFC